MLTHGELFAGISGFGLGLGRAGIETLWHVEIDPNCQNVLRRHYPDALLLSDVRECGKHNLPYVDIITFGSPCQDLSVAGKREGLQGDRSGLFFEAIRIVGELKPAVAVWENVPGALSSNAGRDFTAVLCAFRECGARDIAWRVLDAQYLRVAQRRRRVFVVADFGGERAAEILFESARCGWNPAESREAGKGSATYTPGGFGKYRQGAGTLRAEGGDCGPGSEVLAVGIDGSELGYALRANPSHSGDKGDGGINTSFAIDARNSREQPDGVSGTLQGKKTGGYSLNYQNPVAVGFSRIDDGGDAVEELAPTMRVGSGSNHDGMPGNLGVAFGGNNTSGPIDTATACNAHGGQGRMDFESETFVAIPINTQIATRHNALGERTGFGIGEDGDPAFTLQENHCHAVAFQQNQRDEVRDLGDVAGSVEAEPGMHQQNFIAFSAGQSSRAHSIAANENVTPPIRAGNSGTNQTPTIAYGIYDEPTPKVGEDVMPTIRNRENGGGFQQAVAFNVDATLNASGSGTDRPGGQGAEPGFYVPSSYGVRRLTPTECARLQGFPDDWGAGQSDSTQYRQYGNAVCVKVTEWLGKRIVQALG